jgi:hypothetical protein
MDRSSLPGMLRDHGLAVKSHLGAAELEMTYLRRSNGRVAGRLLPHFGFVHAG